MPLAVIVINHEGEVNNERVAIGPCMHLRDVVTEFMSNLKQIQIQKRCQHAN